MPGLRFMKDRGEVLTMLKALGAREKEVRLWKNALDNIAIKRLASDW